MMNNLPTIWFPIIPATHEDFVESNLIRFFDMPNIINTHKKQGLIC